MIQVLAISRPRDWIYLSTARQIPFPALHTRTCDSTTSDIWFLVTSLESGQTSSLPRYHCHPDTDQEFRHAPFVYLLIHLFDSAGPTRLAHETLAFLGMHVSCPPPGVVPGSFTQDPAIQFTDSLPSLGGFPPSRRMSRTAR